MKAQIPDTTCLSSQQQTFGFPELLQRLQMDCDMEELQGSMRFMGSLFREHLLPYALVHTLVSDLASHSEKARHILLRPADPARNPSQRITLSGAQFHHPPCFRHVVRQVDTLFHVRALSLQSGRQVAFFWLHSAAQRKIISITMTVDWLLQSLASVHAQPLVALALVSLLHMCTDAYISAELEAHGQAAGQHVRHLSTVLMRLRASVDTSAELSSDVQVCPGLTLHSLVAQMHTEPPETSSRHCHGARSCPLQI